LEEKGAKKRREKKKRRRKKETRRELLKKNYYVKSRRGLDRLFFSSCTDKVSLDCKKLELPMIITANTGVDQNGSDTGC
jgi:hypothetical protein